MRRTLSLLLMFCLLLTQQAGASHALLHMPQELAYPAPEETPQDDSQTRFKPCSVCVVAIQLASAAPP